VAEPRDAELLALLAEIRRMMELVRGNRRAYDDLEVDESRPFPEERRA
jgi:hypothetical protein